MVISSLHNFFSLYLEPIDYMLLAVCTSSYWDVFEDNVNNEDLSF